MLLNTFAHKHGFDLRQRELTEAMIEEGWDGVYWLDRDGEDEPCAGIYTRKGLMTLCSVWGFDEVDGRVYDTQSMKALLKSKRDLA